VPNTQNQTASAFSDTGDISGPLAGVYFSSDGDKAEISNKAMDLFFNMTAGNSAPTAQADGGNRAPVLGVDFYLDLPSAFIDWPEPRSLINAAPDFQNIPTVNINPPDTPVQNAPPPDVSFPDPASGKGGLPAGFQATGSGGVEPPGQCSTCESRRYIDKSDDPSVSFQTPTNVNPNMAAAAVTSHEQEHVRNEKSSAKRDGREIINQTVTLTYDCCPECGRNYVSGGTTRTTSISRSEKDSSQGAEPPKGKDEA